MHVLIAEDSALQRAVLQRAVENLGHQFLLAEDGEAAWRSFQEAQPEVVIADWLMPPMDGLTLCRLIREHPEGAGTYFIFLTGLEDKAHAWEGIEAGADDYLTKPVDFEELGLRLLAAARVTALHRQLADLHRQQGRLEGVWLTAREVAHLLNNDLAPVVGALELLQQRASIPSDLQPLVDGATDGLHRAVRHVQQFQAVVQVEIKEVAGGPTLDLDRSILPPASAAS